MRTKTVTYLRLISISFRLHRLIPMSTTPLGYDLKPALLGEREHGLHQHPTLDHGPLDIDDLTPSGVYGA